MPQTTSLRRVSTILVGALFAVVFVCSGASAAQAASAHGTASIGAHTATSKAVTRSVEHAGHSHAKSPSPLHLATTGPSNAETSPIFAVASTDVSLMSLRANTLFTTSERAPPAL